MITIKSLLLEADLVMRQEVIHQPERWLSNFQEEFYDVADTWRATAGNLQSMQQKFTTKN